MIAIVPEVGRLALGSIFLVAGLIKLRDLASLERAVAGFQLGPRAMTSAFSRCLIAAEVTTGAALMTGFQTRIAALMAIGLLILFAGAIAINLARGHHPACGCFGSQSERISPRSLIRVGMLLGLAAVTFGHLGADLAVPAAVNEFATGFLLFTLAVSVITAGAWVLNLPYPFERWPQLVRELRSGGD